MSERTRLVGLALAAELVFLVVVLIPVLPLVALQAVLLGPKVAFAVGAVATLGLWWLIQPDTGLQGDEISVPQESSLRATIDSLCRGINAPHIDRIALDDRMNAAAFQSRGFLSLVGVRRTLTLGIPLLRLLTADEARAVIAHELGHFSHEHGKLGHWIYQVRGKWDQYLYAHTRSDNFVDSTLKSIASWFVPIFLRQSSGWSKRCEFEADAVAAKATCPQALAQALGKLEVLSLLLDGDLQRKLNADCLRSAQAPACFWDIAVETTEVSSAEALARASRTAAKRPTRLHDTHPPLAERLSAMSTTLESLDWTDGICAGERFLGNAWSTTFADCQFRWQSRAQADWRLKHLKLQWFAGSASATDKAQTSVIAAEALAPSDGTLTQLRELAQENPADARTQYELGTALLRRSLSEGISVVRTAIKLDPRLAVNGHGEICNYQHQHGSVEEIKVAQLRIARAIERMDFLDRQLWSNLMNGKPFPMDAAARALLTEALETERFIDGCWAVRMQLTDLAGLMNTVNFLVVRLDYAKLREEDRDEDEVRTRYASFLKAVCPPDEHVRIHSVMVTEPMNPRLLERLQSTGDALLLAPCTAIMKAIRIDSL